MATKEHEVFRRTTIDGKRTFQVVSTKSKSLLKHIPYCYYLIDLIVSKSLTSHSNELGYVNLRSELLEKVIPSHSRILIISLLQKLQVLEVNDSYSVGNFSKSYKLDSAYPLQELVAVDFDLPIKGQDIEENNSWKERKGKSLCTVLSEKSNKIKQKAIEMIDKKTLDLLRIKEYDFQQRNLFDLNLDYDRIKSDGLLGNPDHPQLNLLLEKVNTGDDLCINVNNSVNRVFSPVTNLKKNYRKYLLCRNGNSLHSIDFKSSHLFHLMKIIMAAKPKVELEKEVEELLSIAIHSDVYEFVASHPTMKKYYLDRSSAKDLFIKSFLYGMYPNRAKSKALKSIFPYTSEFLDKQNRRALSIIIQQSESRLLNNMIMKRIAIEYPNCIALGLFDAVLVDQKHVNQVSTIVREESRNYFGFDVPLTQRSLAHDEILYR